MIFASEKGSALVYILIAIALLAALTFTFIEPSSQQSSSQNSFKTAASLDSQIQLIRSSVQQCLLTYPRGDNAIDTSPSGSDPDANTRYPINPDSTYYSSATPGRSGDRQVRNIRCPGRSSTSDAEDHVKIFSGQSGRYLPPAPDLFGEWQLYNGEDGVFFWISTDKSDLSIQSALSKLDEKYSECESDVVDASASARNLDSNALLACASGSTCFRIFMTANATAVYNGDSDGDESACP